MLVDILETLGFGDFDWWNSDIEDGSNGWAPRYDRENVGISLNLKAVKKRSPTVDPKRIYGALVDKPLSDFLSVVADVAMDGDKPITATDAAKVYQRIHMQLIDTRNRVRKLENKYGRNNPIRRFLRKLPFVK